MRDPYADVNSITAGTNTTYVYVDQLDAPAAAADDNGIKMILINRTFLEKIKDEILRTAIERGLRVHEGLEIVYGEIPKRNKACEAKHNLNQTFYHTLLNIIGDVYIEAHGESSFPAFSKYLSLVLSRLKALSVQGEELKTDQERSIEEWIDEILEKKGIKVNPALIKTVNALFEAVRFGEVAAELLDKNVLEDLEYIVIRIFAARRGENVDGVIQASDEIYHYLHKKYNIPPELHIMVEWRSVNSLCEDDEKKQPKNISGLPLLRWKNRNQVEHAIQAAMKETAHKLEELRREGSAGGLLGSPDHAKLTPPTLKDAEFYLSTIRKHVETIRRLQALFKRLAGKRGFASAREGELNLKPSVLQQAYVDSFKPGEDERDYYLVMRHIIPDIDLVIASDASGCCAPLTQIQLADGNIVSIEDAYAQCIKSDALAFDFSTNEFHAKPIARTFRSAAPSHLFEVNTLLTSGLFTKEHRFFALNLASLQLEEKFVSQLKIGDRILVPGTLPIGGNDQTLPRPRNFAYPYKHKGWRMPRIPAILTPTFAQLLGYLTGDGTAHGRMVFATDKNKANLRIYQKLVAKALGLPSDVKIRGERLRLLINNAVLVSYLKTNFPETITGSRKRTISPIVLKSPLRAVATFLRGEFDAEGTPEHHSLRFVTTSRVLAGQMQLTLMRFGIASMRSEHVQPERKIRNRTVKKTRVFYISISDPTSIAAFARQIGFSHPTKQKKLRRMLHRLTNSKRHSRLVTLPLAHAMRHTMRKIAFSRAERHRFKLGQYLHRTAGVEPTKRYLHCLNTKLAQTQKLPIADADLIQLISACHLLHVRFDELAKLTGIHERRLIGRIYTIRHKINRGPLARQRANAIAETIRPTVQERKEAVISELSKQRDALRGILEPIETGTIRLVKVKSVRRHKANTEFVYDLEIAENHNYIANGAITHNSTYGAAPLFSETSICILEAAKRVGKIRTAVVSFGDGIRILKDFNEPVEAGRFYPQSGGGTALGSALEQALTFRWRRGNGTRKVLLILTDGYPDSDQWPIIDQALLDAKRQRIAAVACCVGIEANEDYRRRFDEVYEVRDASDLTESLFEAFWKNCLLVER